MLVLAVAFFGLTSSVQDYPDIASTRHGMGI